MGNAPSHTTSPPSSSTNVAQTSTSAPQPIPTSRPTAHGSSSGTTAATFHSGLTPPAAPPSPPPPSTPPLLPFAGHLSPQNPHCLSHPQAHDYSKSIVTRLIIDGKLAPFYRGLEDFEEDWTEEDVTRVLNELREKDYEEGVSNSYTEQLKEEREGGSTVGSMAKKIKINRGKEQRREAEREERERREKRAYLKAIECPICFLNYPPNINTSRCCQQPVCTECFVQIKRSEATITHLESEPACCPFCMETDFGVIYERPPVDLASLSNSALSTSVASDVGAGTSGFSQALSFGSEAELSVGPGMAPNAQEKARRKSVSHHAPEVVTIDEIRPDWESKLNAVKAAAARRASRRIVMRQVGDRLIPIGYTSSRAPGTADFSMSIPQGSRSNTPGGDGRSTRRRESNRERDLEEMMIMEAMRLSLVDHEDHQRKLADERRGSQGPSPLTGTDTPARSISDPAVAGPSSYTSNTGPVILTGPAPGAGTPSPRRASEASSTYGRRTSAASDNKPSGTSKLLSKFNNVRNRASSSASQKSVSFASNTGNGRTPGSRSASISSALGTPTSPVSAPLQTPPAATPTRNPIPIPSPPSTSPLAPIVTPASPTAVQHQQHQTNEATGPAGLPRLSLDMPPLRPSAPEGPPPSRSAGSNEHLNGGTRPTTLERLDSGMSEATVMPSSYAQLDSDEE